MKIYAIEYYDNGMDDKGYANEGEVIKNVALSYLDSCAPFIQDISNGDTVTKTVAQIISEDLHTLYEHHYIEDFAYIHTFNVDI